MISVLVDYIGLKEISETPRSGLYINSLPGISTRRAENIKGDIFESALTTWQEIEKRSILALEADVTLGLGDSIVNFGVEYSAADFVQDRENLFTAPYLYKLGAEFCKEAKHSDAINRFTLIKADRLEELADDFQTQYKEWLERIIAIALKTVGGTGVTFKRKNYLP